MPIPAEAQVTIPSRDEERARALRDIRFRGPSGLDTSPGSQAAIDAAVIADSIVPLWSEAKGAGDSRFLDGQSGDVLEQRAADEGFDPARRPATGASGQVSVQAVSGGALIAAGTELRESKSGTRYQVSIGGTFADGDLVNVAAVDTGPGTNQLPGTKLTFTSPPPGVGPIATVEADSDGEGLTGGRLEETDVELRERIRQRKAHPPASGNDVEVALAAESCPTVPVQRAFVYPAMKGPGTYCLTFTVLPSRSGGARVPTGAQLTAVEGWVKTRFPYDDGLMMTDLIAEDVDFAIGVTWRKDVASWTDAQPWPAYAAGNDALKVTAATSQTVFTVGNTSASYGGFSQPQAGQTIAVFDAESGVFRRKKILSFTGTGPWVITVATQYGASDESYTPIVGQRVCPWSDSLDTLVAPILAYCDGLGPGEMKASFFDAGQRQKRQPESPLEWPATIGNRLISDVQGVSTVFDAELLDPSVPSTVSVGVASVSSNLYQCRYLAAFPQT